MVVEGGCCITIQLRAIEQYFHMALVIAHCKVALSFNIVIRKPGKLQRNKQRSQDLCWKVHDPAQSFVSYSHTLAELRNRHVSIG